MLFNSFPFLFVFLPAALLLHWLVESFRPDWRLPLLVLLSLAFYGYWDWRLLPLLVLSVGLNWCVAELFHKAPRGWLIVGAICLNLLVLAIFKYTAFFIEGLNLLPGIDLAKPSIVLPLGISFFTFHHVMYLTDLKAGRAPRFSLLEYAFYIGFFPQVLAGPLVRWSRGHAPVRASAPICATDAAERFSPAD